mgnify:CR=1 FL=1
MTTQPLGIGVVGCAGIAWRKMLPAMAADPDVRIAAIASRDPARARRFTDRFGGEPVTGYEALLERPDVEAVYVPLPSLLHAEWVERALRAGRHVLSEKPLTAAAEETEALLELARSRGLALLENFMFLLHPQHARVRDLVERGAIGDVRGFGAEFAFPPVADDDSTYDPAAGGGALVNVGVYPVRAALLHLGSGLRVEGAHLHVDERRGVDVSGAALLAGPDGVTAQLTWGMDRVYRSRYMLWGSTGRLEVTWAFTPPPAHRPVIRVERQDHVEEFTLPGADQFANVVRAFVARVREGTPTVLEGEPVLAQARLVDQVRKRARGR